MSSNRPFLSSFLSAFRAHPATYPKTAPPLSTTQNTTAGPAVWTAASTYTGPTQQTQQVHSSPRNIDPRKVGGSTTRSASPGPLNAGSFSPPLQHNVSPLTHANRGPPSPGIETSPYAKPSEPKRIPGNMHTTSTAAVGIPSSSLSRRRGSDSSSEGGFRDVASSRGQEKWYIGGRTAGGEERYYKLSMVRRERSADRLSADRLSL